MAERLEAGEPDWEGCSVRPPHPLGPAVRRWPSSPAAGLSPAVPEALTQTQMGLPCFQKRVPARTTLTSSRPTAVTASVARSVTTASHPFRASHRATARTFGTGAHDAERLQRLASRSHERLPPVTTSPAVFAFCQASAPGPREGSLERHPRQPEKRCHGLRLPGGKSPSAHPVQRPRPWGCPSPSISE